MEQNGNASGQASGALPPAKEPLWSRGFTRIWIMNLVLCSWAFMLNAPFPIYIVQLGGSELLVGIVVAGFALTSIIMRPIAGWMVDNRSRGGLLKWGLAFIFIISLLYLVAPILSVAVTLRVVSGFLYSGASTACNTNACDAIPKRRFGEGLGLLGLGNTLATALGPALGLAVLSAFGSTALFAASFGVALLAVVIARGLSFKNVQRRPYFPIREKIRPSELFNKDALPASAVMLFSSAPYGGVQAFIALYGAAYGLGAAGVFFILLALGTGSTRVFAGRIADRRGEKPMLAIGNGFFFAALLMLLLKNTPCYYLSGLFFGFGFGFSIPAMQSMSMRVVPPEKRGSASSTFLCAYDVSSVLGGLAAGGLVTIMGYRPMFALLGVYLVISCLIYIFWASKTPSAFANLR